SLSNPGMEVEATEETTLATAPTTRAGTACSLTIRAACTSLSMEKSPMARPSIRVQAVEAMARNSLTESESSASARTMEQIWEKSSDNGATWVTEFRGEYLRKKL